MNPSPAPRPQSFCGFCGYTDAQPFTYCPRCGRPAAALLNAQTQASSPNLDSGTLGTQMGATFGEAPTQARTNLPGPSQPLRPPTTPQAGAPPAGWPVGPAAQNTPPPNWYSGPTAQNAPPAGWAAGPTAQGAPFTQTGAYPGAPNASPVTQPPAPRKRWSKKKRVLVFGLPLVLILGLTAGVFAFVASLLSYDPAEAARFLPASTLAYSSIDVVAVAKNSQTLSQSDVNNTANTSGFQQATGLDFQSDVMPWIKNGFTYALVNIAQKADDFGSHPVYETVFLISTHDTSASNAAIRKVVNAQESRYGVKFTSISYGGVTFQSDADSIQTLGNDFQNQQAGATPLVLGVVKDQVFVASTVAVAEQVIDSANGNADTLANNASFKDALSKMPSDRFATLYLNVRGLVHAELTPGQNGGNLGTIDSYPVAYGYGQFTSNGLRVGFTLQAAPGTHLKYNVSGNAAASAAVVPASAFLYGGLGNLGNFYQQVQDLSGQKNLDSSFQQTYGLSLDDPLFQAPLSFALLAPSGQNGQGGENPDVLVALHVSGDVQQADAKIQSAFQYANYETESQTVSGVTVLAVQEPVQEYDDFGNPTTVYQTQGYYAALAHDLVFASSLDAITQAIQTSQGKIASLASSGAFQSAVKQGPANTAVSLFISLENLANAPGALGDSFRSFMKTDHSIISKIKTAYVTYTWDDSGISLTATVVVK